MTNYEKYKEALIKDLCDYYMEYGSCAICIARDMRNNPEIFYCCDCMKAWLETEVDNDA